MGIKRRYRNIVEKFLSRDQGKRFFQFFYSWGAAIVIIGALAKLMHWPHNLGNILLTVGLITEFFVFFISAFDRPPKDYKWEEVFPVLDSKDPDDRPVLNGNGRGGSSYGSSGGNGVPVSGNMEGAVEGIRPKGGVAGGVSGTVIIAGGGYSGPGGAAAQGGAGEDAPLTEGQIKKSFGIPSNVNISEEDTNALTASIKKLSGAAEQLAKMSELTDATQQYLEQMSQVSENMQKFNSVTNDLTEVSDTLLNSYKHITDNSDGISENSKGYVQQMETLNHNISQLNSVYELQLQSVNSQMEAVNRINAGLLRIREMYEGSVIDSSMFRSETEKMTQQIAALNTVYSRLLNAMTMNMNMQGAMGGQAYHGGQAYNPNPGYNPAGAYQQPNPGYYNPGYTPPQPPPNPQRTQENGENNPK